MPAKTEKMTFEQAFTSLGQTLQKLETGDLPLAEAIALYEQGMNLVQYCNHQLDTAELTIKKLTPGGQTETMP